MAIALHGSPASLLCDNGAVFTATPRGGKVLLQSELERLGITANLANQEPARTLAGLQAQLDPFSSYYNAKGPTGRWTGARPRGPTAPGVKTRRRFLADQQPDVPDVDRVMSCLFEEPR
jgi:hypothetical protein